MSWTEQDPIGNKREWRRADNYATISLRETKRGDWAVSFDRLIQAPEGQLYKHEVVDSEAEALELVSEWQEQFSSQ